MTTVAQPSSLPSGPSWEIAHLSQNQGTWTVEDYLALNAHQLVELSDGVLEVLPLPREELQSIVAFLYEKVKAFVAPQGLGKVLFAPLSIQLWEEKFRQPDVLFMLAENAWRRSNEYWRGADLVMEVVSQDDPDRDLTTKRAEYARAAIREYWIVDPRDRTITVFGLDPATSTYEVVGKYVSGDVARSVLLDGFTLDVREVFSQC